MSLGGKAQRLQLLLNLLRIRIGDQVMRTVGYLVTFETQTVYCDSRPHRENAEFGDLVECPLLPFPAPLRALSPGWS